MDIPSTIFLTLDSKVFKGCISGYPFETRKWKEFISQLPSSTHQPVYPETVIMMYFPVCEYLLSNSGSIFYFSAVKGATV